MAAASLFALLDDIATVLDDVSVLSKVAIKKTSGVLGDDLAVNAEQVSGVRAERELPVVWAVFKGSVLNKLILVPAALILSTLLPIAVTVLLLFGGLYLCFEGVEKAWHYFAHKAEQDNHKQALKQALLDKSIDFLTLEKQKVKGAIRTDFVLSAEIIIICLGSVATASLMTKALVLVSVAALITIAVYGLVAFIVKLDDMALFLMRSQSAGLAGKIKQNIGSGLLAFCPWLMRGLSFFGTIAMFLVGGGIIVHSIPFLHHLIEQITATSLGIIHTSLLVLCNFLIGLSAGAVCVACVKFIAHIRHR